MTEDDIAATARQFPSLSIHRPESYPELLVAQKGDTLILLGLREARLETHQVTWISGLTKRSSLLKHNLCSGAKYVELHLVGSSDLAGASVWLDGQFVGQLADFGDLDRDVQLGRHQLRVQKSGIGSWSTELHYDESSSGYDRLPIPEDEFVPGDA